MATVNKHASRPEGRRGRAWARARGSAGIGAAARRATPYASPPAMVDPLEGRVMMSTSPSAASGDRPLSVAELTVPLIRPSAAAFGAAVQPRAAVLGPVQATAAKAGGTTAAASQAGPVLAKTTVVAAKLANPSPRSLFGGLFDWFSKLWKGVDKLVKAAPKVWKAVKAIWNDVKDIIKQSKDIYQELMSAFEDSGSSAGAGATGKAIVKVRSLAAGTPTHLAYATFVGELLRQSPSSLRTVDAHERKIRLTDLSNLVPSSDPSPHVVRAGHEFYTREYTNVVTGQKYVVSRWRTGANWAARVLPVTSLTDLAIR